MGFDRHLGWEFLLTFFQKINITKHVSFRFKGGNSSRHGDLYRGICNNPGMNRKCNLTQKYYMETVI